MTCGTAVPPIRPPLLRPPQGLPPGVVAGMSLRRGGVSGPPFADWNLRPTVWNAGLVAGDADDPSALLENQRRFREALGVSPVYVRQVHGAQVHRVHAGAEPDDPLRIGDALWTTAPGIACTVLVADCLPVLLWDAAGTVVAAVHAGWRGLAAGVLERTVHALVRDAGVDPASLQAWLAPCIGPGAFEVGIEVLEGLGVDPRALPETVRWTPRPDGAPRWHIDLQGMAVQRLERVGVHHCTRTPRCTVSDPSAFFSFRREGRTGRMAAAVGLLPR